MTKKRLKYLQGEADAGRLDLVELAEIEAEFEKIPDDQLRDLRENAVATDMLEEIESHNA